jgi:streptomycin 6-kinase
MPTSTPFGVPAALAASHTGDPGGRAWIAALPRLVTDTLGRWDLRPDGPAAHGQAGVALPVRRAEGTPAVLKLQRPTPEGADTAVGLRAWNGAGAVLLLDHDPESNALLLERLDADRPLSSLPDADTALTVLAGLLARLTAVPAPPGVRRLGDIAAAMLAEVPREVPLRAESERRLVRTCAAAVAEVAADGCGDRLLHWDLHEDNVLAGDREPWLAIDPEPLAGDPGFDLWPALEGRWAEPRSGGDVRRAILRRFDLLTDALGLDRRRATAWTLGRILQNALWTIADGEEELDGTDTAIADALLSREPRTPR